MPLLEKLQAGQRLSGVIPGAIVEVVSVEMHGAGAVQLVFRLPDGSLGERVLQRRDEAELEIVEKSARPFDAEATSFKLVAEAQRIKLAGLFDPMLAVTTQRHPAAAPPDPGRLRRAAAAHSAAVPARRRPRRRQDDHGRALHQGADAARRRQALPDRRPRRPGRAVAGRAVPQVRARASSSSRTQLIETAFGASTSSSSTRC